MSTEGAKKAYIPEMQIARGIGILLVTFGHSEPIKQVFPGIWQIIYSFHMPLFFFMSGFFSLALIHRDWYRKVLPSTLRLYVPYLVISASYGLIKMLIPSLAKRPVIPSELLGQVLFYPFENPALFLWFIYILLLMKLLSPVFRNQRYRWLLPIFFLTACWHGTYAFLGIFSLLKHLVYYTAGLVIAEKRDQFLIFLKNLRFRFFALFLFPVLYIFGSSYETGPLPVFIAFSGIWLSLSISCLSWPRTIARILEFCGKRSLEIYLLQYYFIFPTLFLLNAKGVPPQFIVACSFCVGLVGPLLTCYLILDRNRYLSLLFSGHPQR